MLILFTFDEGNETDFFVILCKNMLFNNRSNTYMFTVYQLKFVLRSVVKKHVCIHHLKLSNSSFMTSKFYIRLISETNSFKFNSIKFCAKMKHVWRPISQKTLNIADTHF